MDLSIGVLLVLAALTFLLAVVLQCLSLRKHEELIERLERLQGLHVRHVTEPRAGWSTEDLPSGQIVSRRHG
jgi:hypothetical protein